MVSKQSSRWGWVYLLVALLVLGVLGVLGLAAGARAEAPPVGADGGARGTVAPSRVLTCTTSYGISESSGAQVTAGTDLVAGSRCDDCLADVALPFSFRLYGTPYSTVKVNSDGYMLFTGATVSFVNSCLPYANFANAQMPYWDDLRTDCTGCGIYTSVSGSAPNRVFNIEWRASTFIPSGQSLNFEVRLYEGLDSFDFVYGQAINGGNSVTVGVQENGTGSFTQYSCNNAALSAGKLLNFTLAACPTGTPGVTPVPTATPLPGPIVQGHATWDGRPEQPDPGQELPIKLTLRPAAGGSIIGFPYQTTDASGYFNVPVAGLANGTYLWLAEGPNYLANSGTLVLDGAPVTLLEVGLMRAGDANGDNAVNLVDFMIYKGTFSRACGDPSYQGRADFNGDCTVDTRDFVLLKRNFGRVGAPPLESGGQ